MCHRKPKKIPCTGTETGRHRISCCSKHRRARKCWQSRWHCDCECDTDRQRCVDDHAHFQFHASSRQNKVPSALFDWSPQISLNAARTPKIVAYTTIRAMTRTLVFLSASIIVKKLPTNLRNGVFPATRKNTQVSCTQKPVVPSGDWHIKWFLFDTTWAVSYSLIFPHFNARYIFWPMTVQCAWWP